MNLEIPITDELIETIARRAAELVVAGDDDRHNVGYLDVGAAAEFLACPMSRIYALVSAKRIPHHRDGSRLLFERAELREYIAAGGARRP